MPDVLQMCRDRLLAAAAPLLQSDQRENDDIGYDRFFDAPAALGDRVSPELRVWIEDRVAMQLASSDHEAWVPSGCSRLFDASRTQDAQWMIRLQSIFLPVSSIRLWDELYATASWHATDAGTSRVYITHQDEPGVWRRHSAIASLVAEVAGTPVPDVADEAAFPPHLDAEVLQHRTRWIGELLIAQHVTLFDTSNGLIYDRLEGVPSFAMYAEERALVAQWPHLQAYWITHHMLLRNRDALADVLVLADDRYPPIAELREIAQAFDAGHEPRQLVTFGRHQALRWDLVKHGTDAMDPDALDQVREELAVHEQQLAAADACLATLRGSADASTQTALTAWDMLASAAGGLKAVERALLQALDNPEEVSRMEMRLMTGETSTLIVAYQDLLDHVDARWTPLFEAVFTAGGSVDDEHGDAAPGSLVGWGKALGSYAALREAIRPLCRSAGRWRHLELAMVADRYIDDPGAEEFLLTEMGDFLKEFGDFSRTTTSFAWFALLRRGHPRAIEAANAALARAPLTGASWHLVLAVFSHAAAHEQVELLPGMQACIERGFGRHDDGTRSEVVTTWARLARDAAVPVLERMIPEILDVRDDCEKAALLAGLLVADLGHASALADAPATVEALLNRGGSMRIGAAVGLLRAMVEAPFDAMQDLLARALEAARAEEHTAPAQLRWLGSVAS